MLGSAQFIIFLGHLIPPLTPSIAMTRRLLVLDLNGTILHRLTHSFESKLFRQHPVVISKSLKPDITVNGSKIVFRPHAAVFLAHVLKHFDVAVWTSSRAQNAIPMVHHSFKPLLDFANVLDEAARYNLSVRQVILGPSEKGAQLMKDRLLEETRNRARLKFIWTQSECDICPSDNVVKLKTDLSATNTNQQKINSPESSTLHTGTYFIKPLRKKDLSKIYSTFPSTYTPLNTLIIDDTNEKLIDHLKNHLRIQEFDVIDHDTDYTQDRHLLKLKKYLEFLVKEDPQDIRSFLAKYSLDDF